MTSYLDVCTMSIEEYANEDISKIHLTDDQTPWDPSTSEYSERKTQMLDHQSQTNIPSAATKRLVYVSAVISYSLGYDTTDAMDNHNICTLGIALIGMGRKPSVESIVLAKVRALPLRRLGRLFKP